VSDEQDLKRFVGKLTTKSRVVIERGPVTNFATAVLADHPAYRDPRAAEQAGLPGMPVPPTFPFAMETWGRFVEIQPPDAPSGNPMAEILGPLMAKGGLILHGEQEFEYHRPLHVGDVLVGEGRVADVYTKESNGRVMTFVVTETVWRDDKTGEPVVTSRTNVLHRA
jgi:acyl dehydratase